MEILGFGGPRAALTVRLGRTPTQQTALPVGSAVPQGAPQGRPGPTVTRVTKESVTLPAGDSGAQASGKIQRPRELGMSTALVCILSMPRVFHAACLSKIPGYISEIQTERGTLNFFVG